MKTFIAILVIVAVVAIVLALTMKKRDTATTEHVDPPVDLDTPVTNPRLLAAMKADLAAPSDATKQALVTQLNRAVFLVATIMDEATVVPREREGQVTLKQGSLLKFLLEGDDAGNTFLALFTDWEQIAKYTDKKVTGVVMPAEQAWTFVLRDQTHAGVIINPADPRLPIPRDMIELLVEQGRSKQRKPIP